MKTTITCPTCQQEHGLFWLRSGPKPEDRTLNYRCNRAQRLVTTAAGSGINRDELHSFTETRMAGAVKGAEQMQLPEEWTASYRKAMKDKGQQQFVLMYTK